ncbi:MAG: hypothetical protein GY720_01195 [bacterium]|nr:hypothetical protein [bacterium]
MSVRLFPPMPENFEPTRATLHQYSNAIGVIPRVHADPHEKWWHVSLNVTERGLETNEMVLPSGGTLSLRLDFKEHRVVVEADGHEVAGFGMDEGLTGTQMGEAVIAAVSTLGLDGEYARDKFESDEPREYSADAAAGFFEVLTSIHSAYSVHRDRIGDSAGPLQLWPHGFDLAFEWFGTRIEDYEEHGEMTKLPAQCNFGFYPAGRAYLYANPWPFEGDTLLAVELPGGAEWHTDGWEGSELFYDQIAGDERAEQRILDFFGAVFDAAKPTLSA